MKYAVVLCDGMADYPISALKDQTPMSVAKKPCMDFLSSKGQVGLVKTVPDGMKPGSDVANLSVNGIRSSPILHRAFSLRSRFYRH